jgi:four helix bundle protein
MRIFRFEDIESWKEGRILCRMVYDASENSRFKNDFGLKDQIRRAAVSVMSNIAEGFDSRSNAEFRRFLVMARRSASEVKSQLYVAVDRSYINRKDFEVIYDQCDKVGKLINGFIRFLSSSQKPSSR